MSTGVIIALIVIVAAVAVVAAAVTILARRPQGGRSLQRRFGPEYDRTVARHDGDTKAAEHDLAERVRRHGSLRERALEPAVRDKYVVRWAAAQERFVESPREAVAEADRLIGEVAGARGFPDGQYEEQYAALSVHHGPHVLGYRRVHRAALARTPDGDGAGTEGLRKAMVEARALFEELVTPVRQDTSSNGADEKSPTAPTASNRPEGSVPEGRTHLPWSFTRRQAKGS
ncbi:hypothetical protein OG548_31280 [Streptomyces sp. NBC_01356]|uniref:hypothetical protein n=1 Tax=Streptomyces sp. NBC_01356 TaxID=2903836 RepID=UPI002E2F676D|nr:hypothetical protein [Streptomyces sp. NBC_01356]